ncbi:hypothetical protein [Novosphingobium sp. BL-52-GroH]|uniref:hypothetical protein n=1 Tax=Novosphingobium sp. BL-52-GroH TaxID=3349877 RepID=UPI00384ACF28
MIDENDRAWMREAIALARTKGTSPQDTPIAAIIVLDGLELIEQHHVWKLNRVGVTHLGIPI